VPTFEAVPIPPPVLEHHRKITIFADFFYAQGVLVFNSISRGIGFCTVKPVTNHDKSTILQELEAVVKLYQHCGFHVCDIHADQEFACVRTDLLPVELNIVPADSHVGEVECSIRTIKEHLHSCVHGLPFQRVPKLLIQRMVTDVICCLKQFPWKNGISIDMSPATLVTGHQMPDYNLMRLEFGSYVQVFEDNTPSNTPQARSLGEIALDPTGNGLPFP